MTTLTKVKRPVETDFKQEAEYIAEMVRWRCYEMSRKGMEVTMQKCYDVQNCGTYVEGSIASFEHEGVAYTMRIYFMPTPASETMVIRRDFLPMEAECACLDMRDFSQGTDSTTITPPLPALCRGLHGKTRVWPRPSVRNVDSVCVHILCLQREILTAFRDGKVY